MLILTRRTGEAIRIGKDIRIVVVQLGGGKVAGSKRFLQ